MKLLLVEDEKQLSEALAQILKRNKYSVDAVYNGEEGLDYALTGIYDVIILDIMLPKVKGLDAGADDYLAKPFVADELLARLRALGRRKGEIISDDILSFSDFSLNLSTYILEGNSRSVRLALKEFDIMKYFLLRPGRVINKEDLITKLWGFESEAENNNIEVYISFLRKKLQFIGSEAKISTIRGVGYKLEGN